MSPKALRENLTMDLAIVIVCLALSYLAGRVAHISAAGTLAVIGDVVAASSRLAAQGLSWKAVGVRLPENRGFLMMQHRSCISAYAQMGSTDE
jgi:hypothetical protein